MRSIWPIRALSLPITQQALWNANDGSGTPVNNASPTALQWDSTSFPLQFTMHVPEGERWLVNFLLQAWIQGNAAPSYQICFGLVLKGATVFQPPQPNGPSPWNYRLGIGTSGDQAWGTVAVPMWLEPGATECCFAYGRDAGAISLARRHISGVPFLGMKI